MLLRQLLRVSTRRKRARSTSRRGRSSGLILCASGIRSTRSNRARVSESTVSVFTLAVRIAFSFLAGASVSSIPCAAHRSATPYQLPVLSTTARCGPGSAEK